MTKSASLIALLFATTATSCVMGPDYAPPAPLQVDAFSSLTESHPDLVAEGLELKSDWWQSFGDEELTRLVETALVQNPDLRVATARVRQSKANRKIASAALYPSVNVSGSAQTFENSEVALTPAQGVLNSELFDVSADAAWQVDLFGKVQRGVDASEASYAASIEDRRGVMLVVISEVVLNYANLRSSQNQFRVAQENERIARKTVELTELLSAQELGSEFDIVRARADLKETLAVQSDLLAAQRVFAANIAALTGEAPFALVDDLIEPTETELVTPSIPLGLPSDLIRRRPDVRAAERRYAQSVATIGLEVADLYPSFVLTGSVGTNALDLSDLFTSPSQVLSLAGILDWPVFDYGRRKAEIAIAEAGAEAALASYDASVINAYRDVEQALSTYVFADQKLDQLQSARTERLRALELAELRYQSGVDDLFVVLEAQRRLTGLQSSIAETEADKIEAVVRVYQSLGGGWDIAEQSLAPASDG